MMKAWKLTTYDLRPPFRGGNPIWDGSVPHTLPTVAVDTSDRKCAPGWSAYRDLAEAIRLVGEWPDGRPPRAWLVESIDGHEPVERGERLRAATWRIVREATAEEWREARLRLYAPLAGDGLAVAEIVAEVEAWRDALARPMRDEDAVTAGLREALHIQGLDWKMRRYGKPAAAWYDRHVRAGWPAWGSWDACGDWDDWDDRDARDALDAWGAWGPKGERGAWGAWDTWDAWGAWDALVVFVARRRGWAPHKPKSAPTTSLRYAYRHGLGVAVPVAPGVLGWAMDAEQP